MTASPSRMYNSFINVVPHQGWLTFMTIEVGCDLTPLDSALILMAYCPGFKLFIVMFEDPLETEFHGPESME